MGLSLTILILGSMLSSIPASAVVATNPTPDCSAGTTCTITFIYTGDFYSWTVPSGITSITVDAYGAEGGRSNFRANTAVPGKGGRVQATLNTTSGETLHIYVGGAGSSVTSTSANSASAGWNGGGRGGFGNGSGHWGGGGGGATDIRTTLVMKMAVMEVDYLALQAQILQTVTLVRPVEARKLPEEGEQHIQVGGQLRLERKVLEEMLKQMNQQLLQQL